MWDPEVEHLIHGVTDNIINNLSRISELQCCRVVRLFRYTTKEINPPASGRDLSAQVVLVGRSTPVCSPMRLMWN